MGQSNAKGKRKKQGNKKRGGNNNNNNSKDNQQGASPSSSTTSMEESFVDVRPTASNDSSSRKDAAAPKPRQRIAVIGGGVSGLACAWHLEQNCDNYEVHLLEAKDKLGGHACTVPVPTDYTTSNSIIDVDIGFMVCNEANYPNLMAWFHALQVETEQSDMSLAVSLDSGETIEWSSSNPGGLLGGGWKRATSSYRFLQDMLRFNHTAAEILLLDAADPRRHVSTRDYLKQNGYSEQFATYYLLPMMAALWSASLDDVMQFPAAQLVGFLANHKMLQLFDRPQWKTVAGRSQQYVAKVQNCLKNVHCGAVVARVERQPADGRYRVVLDNKNNDKAALPLFDQVVFACHPPTAADMLVENNLDNNETTGNTTDLLRQIEYADNVLYVHSAPSLMPTNTANWASWNCLGSSRELARMQQSSSKKAPSASPHRKKTDKATTTQLEGTEGRFKAVYVT